MKFQCNRCGNILFITTPVCVCNICGKRYLEQEIIEIEKHNNNELKEFRNNIDKTFNKNDSVDNNELNKISEEIQKINNKIDEQNNKIESVQDSMDIIKKLIDEEIEIRKNLKADVEKAQDFSAKVLIENGEYILFAAKLYSNIEDNLVSKFGLKHYKNDFIMEETFKTDLIENHFEAIKYYNFKTKKYEVPSFETVKIFNKKNCGEFDIYYKMTPAARFVQAGLTDKNAFLGQEYWHNVLNAIRHINSDTKKRLSDYLSKNGVNNEKDKQNLYLKILKFFKDNGLYDDK